MGRCKNRNRYLENIDFIKLISYGKDHLFSMKYISKCSKIIYERKCQRMNIICPELSFYVH